MAEKRVSVRLSATGGRQVRAELEGVGEAGSRGFGRLSREMEAANARLATFARAAGVALSAAAAAATASLGLIVRSTTESAAELREFAQIAYATPESFQRWTAGARTVGIEKDKLADILKDVNDRVGDFIQTSGGPMADFFEKVAPRVGVTAEAFAKLSGPEALQLFVDTLERAGLSQQEMTFHMEAMASDATRLLPLLRDGGAEMARLGDEAESLGAVLDGNALEALKRTQLALDRVSLVLEGLQNRIAVAAAPALEALASAFVAVASEGGILLRAIDGLMENLARLATYAATFAAFLAGRWIAAMAAAALSVRVLATALVFLRGALIRTGIGALIVGAGELVYQFGRLVAATGGFGNAMTLLADVAAEVWDRIKLGGEALTLALRSEWARIEAAWLSVMARIQKSLADLLHRVAHGLRGLPGLDGTMLQVSGAAVRAGSGYYELAHSVTEATARADGLAASASEAAKAVFGPLRSLAALGQAAEKAGDTGEAAISRAATAAGALETGLARADETAKAATPEIEKAAEVAKTGWEAATGALAQYAKEAADLGKGIGATLVDAFRAAEEAFAEFVQTGKVDFRSLINEMLVDLARLSARKFVLGPLSNALSGAISRVGSMFTGVFNRTGLVGGSGLATGTNNTAGMQLIPGMTFSSAIRLHDGGVAGLRPDEVPAILQRGERVLSRRETAAYHRGHAPGGFTINIVTRDAESFARSRTQVAADVARAVALGRRGL